MIKDTDILRKIEKKLQQFVNVERKSDIEEFERYVFEEILCKELGYDYLSISDLKCKPREVIVDKKLKIKITLDEVNERSTANRLFREYTKNGVKNSFVEWGLVLSPKGIWLFNNNIHDDGKLDFQTKKTVLKIVFGNNSDQKYFDFYSCKNILGYEPNVNYFKDIAEYRNHFYKGSEKSWAAYSSTLKRFFKHYSQSEGYLKNGHDSIYNKIKITDFYRYINEETKLEKENTLKNVFFYIKDFMSCMSDNSAFDISTKDMVEGFYKTLKKNERKDVIDEVKLKRALQYLNSGKNRERDTAIFLMELSFGLERRKLRLLRWDVNFSDRENGITGSMEELIVDGKSRNMPKELIKALERLRALEMPGEYVFYRTKEKGSEPMREDAVNSVFSRLTTIDPKDEYYRSLTPANIRGSLVRYLLRKGESLEKIIYFMNIEIGNLGNYISSKDIDGIIEKRIEDSKKAEEYQHPMEDFLKELLK